MLSIGPCQQAIANRHAIDMITSMEQSDPGFLYYFGIAAAAIVIYFLPWIVALLRGSVRTGGVAVLNIFLGWTFLGWVIALAWAAGSDKKS